MVSAEFKTAIPAINHLHTYALHRIATRIGSWCFYFVILCARICSPVFNTCSPRHLPTHLLAHLQNHTSIHLPTHLRVLSNHQLLDHTPSYKYLPLYLPTCWGYRTVRLTFRALYSCLYSFASGRTRKGSLRNKACTYDTYQSKRNVDTQPCPEMDSNPRQKRGHAF